MLSMVGVVGRGPAEDEKMMFVPAGLREAQTCRYSFYSVVQNGVFASHGRHLALIKVKFGTEERTLPRAKFHVHRSKNVGTQPPKLSKFPILRTNFLLRGNSFGQFFTKFSAFIRVYR